MNNEPEPARKTALTAMTPRDLARLLSAAGSRRIAAEMIEADLAAGAPANPDGTLNLVHYVAWLARETRTGTAGQTGQSQEVLDDAC